MPSSRRDFFDLVARAAALPAGAEFFSTWLRAQPTHPHSSAPSKPALLQNYQPKFFGEADFAALQSFCEILMAVDRR
jgi:hypothetical protein